MTTWRDSDGQWNGRYYLRRSHSVENTIVLRIRMTNVASYRG